MIVLQNSLKIVYESFKIIEENPLKVLEYPPKFFKNPSRSVFLGFCISKNSIPFFSSLSRDVRIFSSYNQSLNQSNNNNNKTFGLVGMSQLVSTLLETVQTMWTAGASPFQCMSFIEAKLQEIYLQSEALASFLLATEFCSLNLLTQALELTDNDIPLLLAVASIHSPQVTKKYGISSR